MAAVLTGFVGLLLNGTYRFEGPVVVRVTPTHGLHAGDVLLLLGWLAAMLALTALVRSRRN
ncbi:hypothetical protein GCM10011381_26690 [Klenkia taihuensis]|uniref:Uncharacterized protein n=1 Tax=Klenkia taihuensis TaxID=1225127 RepID=A0A1I1P196_9ACTN|nr:hypothetical protein GCM10011381_26690 [Klenkia taihuensis]SFC99730.1 hypothetical protein SAMN05661030_2223 [Klenkia taihuensis]